MANHHVTIHADGREALADLVRTHRITVLAQTLHTAEDPRVGAVVDEATVERLEVAGYRVERHEDVDDEAAVAPSEAATSGAAVGAASTRYLTADEVDATVIALGERHPDTVDVVTLPEATWEGRTSRALRVHPGSATASAAVYLLGGVHAREWGSSDLLIDLVRLFTDAARDGTGITRGGATIGADDVRAVADTLDLVVLPLANPDGRHHSMTNDPLWRKNRRPHDRAGRCPTGNGDGPGVDINRNYDFLWDYSAKFSPHAPVRTSTDPCSAVYAGPAAASEPETRNVVWLLEQNPGVGYFVDVHSFGEDILYNWGDDNDQTTTPTMNFANPAFDGERGVPDSTPGGGHYREYVPPGDRDTLIRLGTAMSGAIRQAHGRTYTVKESVDLYPTSGTSNDYAYARSFLDGHARKVLGFVIEWGPARPSVTKSFHPDYPDMIPIIEEVTAGLLAFCVAVARAHQA
jgi:murein tripeptide amidase MpaA